MALYLGSTEIHTLKLGTKTVQKIYLGTTEVYTAFTAFNEINVAQTNQPVPDGTSGCYVTLIGAGGHGGSGTSVGNCSGGAGGGGGGRVNRTWIPVSSLGSTYTTSFGIDGTNSVFSSGSITLTAEGGAAGANAVSGGIANGGAGGSWSASPTSIDGVAVTGADGTAGGQSNWNQTGGSNGVSDSVNDVGCGGGGGRSSWANGPIGNVTSGGSSMTVTGTTGQPANVDDAASCTWWRWWR